MENLTDFFALELDEGKLKYYLNFGDQTQIGSILEVSSTLDLKDPNSQSRQLKRILLEKNLSVSANSPPHCDFSQISIINI